MRKVDYIVIHTAAADIDEVDVEVIRKWHKARGWSDIGYHYVIMNDRHSKYNDGDVLKGRDEETIGAHALGINANSIGICCLGHGDKTPFTEKQMISLVAKIKDLMLKYGVRLENVIGHREVNKLVDAGKLAAQYRTDKSCPGKLVDMEVIRAYVNRGHGPDSYIVAQELVNAFIAIEAHMNTFYPNAADEWKLFRYHPEVIKLMGD